MKQLLLTFILLSISSCAIVSKKDCANLDWSVKAQEDLHKNRDWEKYLARYEKVCSKHGHSMKAAYMNGVEAKGGKLCTGLQDFPESGWVGVGSRDALGASLPGADKYTEKCTKYKIAVDKVKYDEGVASVGARACSSFDDFESLGWSGVGVRDAKAGRLNDLNNYIEKCRTHYFTEVNEKDFNEGFNNGLKVFCKKKSGFEFAKNGGAYNKTCIRNERSFLIGFKIGSDVKKADALEKEFNSAVSSADKITNDISSWHDEIENLNVELTSKLNSYKNDKEDIQDEIKTNSRRMMDETDVSRQKEIEEKLADLREDAIELEDKIANSETSTKKALEEARFSISKLREERRQLDREIPSLESRYRAARSKADKGLHSL
jgi:predicted  nucleic acid-binding Zn-ribbon protein